MNEASVQAPGRPEPVVTEALHCHLAENNRPVFTVEGRPSLLHTSRPPHERTKYLPGCPILFCTVERVILQHHNACKPKSSKTPVIGITITQEKLKLTPLRGITEAQDVSPAVPKHVDGSAAKKHQERLFFTAPGTAEVTYELKALDPQPCFHRKRFRVETNKNNNLKHGKRGSALSLLKTPHPPPSMFLRYGGTGTTV